MLPAAASSHCRCNRCAEQCDGKLQNKRSVCAKCRDKRCVCKVCGQARRKLTSAHEEYVAPCKCTKSAPPGRAKRLVPPPLTDDDIVQASAMPPPLNVTTSSEPDIKLKASRASARVHRSVRPGDRPKLDLNGLLQTDVAAEAQEEEDDKPFKRARQDDNASSTPSSVLFSSVHSTPSAPAAQPPTAPMPLLVINSANLVGRDADYENMAATAVANHHIKAREELELGLSAAATACALPGVKENLVEKMEAGLRVSAGAFFISDPHQPTFPIVYASKSFLNLTGYARADVLGQNCSFLQGPGVDTADVRTLADSYDGCTPCDVLSVDLKKNGDKFWNFMHLEPTPHGLGGKSTLVVHAQSDVSEYVEAVAIYGGAHAAQHMPSVRPTGSSCDDEFDEFTSSGDDLSADALPAGDPHQMARFDPLRHIVDDTGENFHGGSPALAVDVTTMMEFVDDCLVQVPDPHSDPWFQTPEDHNEWTIPVASSGIF